MAPDCRIRVESCKGLWWSPPHPSFYPLLVLSLPGTQTRFSQEPADQTVVAGQRVVLPCVLLNYSGIVQWTKDGLALGMGQGLKGEWWARTVPLLECMLSWCTALSLTLNPAFENPIPYSKPRFLYLLPILLSILFLTSEVCHFYPAILPYLRLWIGSREVVCGLGDQENSRQTQSGTHQWDAAGRSSRMRCKESKGQPSPPHIVDMLSYCLPFLLFYF